MFCRRVFQRLGPVAQRVFTPTFLKAPVRHMAFGVPGGSTNMTYFVVCGGGLTAAVVYAYKSIIGDSERYEDRLANMGSTAKAEATSAEMVNATAEPTPVKEPEAPVVEVVTESAAAPEEPVADSAAEPVVESTTPEDFGSVAATEEPVADSTAEPVLESTTPEDFGSAAAPEEPVADSTAELVVESTTPEEDVAVVSEAIATEDEAKPTVVEEAPPVVAEDVPTTAEATEETPAEAPASAEAVPDLLTAVKILTSSTVEIAAASVGESNLMRAVRHIEEDGKGSDSVLEALQPEALEGTQDLTIKDSPHEIVVVTNEEELDSAEVVSCDEEAVTEVKVSAEEITKEASARATEEEEEVPPEEAAPSGPTEEITGEMHAEDQNPAPDPEENIAPEEAASSAEASVITEAPVDEELPVAETFGEDAAEAEVPAEETVAASEEEGSTPEVDTGLEIEALSAAEPESNCHHDSLTQVMTPTADQPSEILEDAGDQMNESREAASPVETPSPEAVVVMINQS
ncbi:uncharacterized protein mgarpb isoform X1 [Vanacampus margaritifer]